MLERVHNNLSLSHSFDMHGMIRRSERGSLSAKSNSCFTRFDLTDGGESTNTNQSQRPSAGPSPRRDEKPDELQRQSCRR